MIQQEALRLFLEKGFEATTIEEIAEAADIAPSTFFNYFPTKEDVVLQDDLDPVLLEAINMEPAGLHPIAVLRKALHHVFSHLTPDQNTGIGTDKPNEADVEHMTFKMLIEQLKAMGPEDEKYGATFTVLGEYIKHHIKEEEDEMFKELARVDLDWETLRSDMEQSREELMEARGLQETEEAEPRERSSSGSSASKGSSASRSAGESRPHAASKPSKDRS